MLDQKRIRKISTAQFNSLWFPILIFIVTFSLVVAASVAFENREENGRLKAVEADAYRVLELINADLNNRVQSLQRIANRWEIRKGTPQNEFISDAQAYIDDAPGYQAIEWVDNSFHVRWIIPLIGNEPAQDLNLGFEEHRRIALENAKAQRSPTLTSPIDLVQGGKGFLAYSPIYIGEEFEGFVLAVFRVQAWLDHILKEEKSLGGNVDKFSHLVFVDDELVYTENSWGNFKESRWDANVEATIMGRRFVLQTRPTKNFIQKSQTLLPLFVFMVGFILCLLVSIAIYLHQKTNKLSIERNKLFHDIGERVKELNCLYDISKLAENRESSIESVLQGATDLMPSSWQHPGDTCARVIFDDCEYLSSKFQETPWKQEAPMLFSGEQNGIIQIFYTKEFPDSYEGPFLEEERYLIDEIAVRLRKMIEQKMMVGLLEIERQRLSDIINGTNAGTWEWNVQTGEILFNDRWANMAGYSLEELESKSIDFWKTLYHPDDLIKSNILLEKHFNGALEYYDCESRMRHKNGDWIWVNDRGRVTKWTADGKPLLMYGAHQDITKRKKAEEKIKEALKIKSDFTSMVSHELRTPLTAIKEGIGIVLDGSCGDINKEQDDYLGTAKRNVDRLARLINDVLDIQKFEAGMMEFNKQENDINRSVQEVFTTMHSLAVDKGLRLEVKVNEELPRTAFDEDKIMQVLTNLLNNSIKFTEKGSITIETDRGDNVVKVSVIDTGPGIKEEDIGKLFGKFEQISTGEGRKTGGTGLGLAICKEIIEGHNGRIWAESVFGKGASFYFVLPIMERRS